MAYYDFTNSLSVGSMFGASSGGGNNLSIISDYSSIRNGSYYKLMKSYYGGNSRLDQLMGENSTATSKDTAKKLTAVKDEADSLKKAADDLYKHGKDSVFKEVTKTGEDGKTITSYDTEAIYKKVSGFVSSYNELLKGAGGVSSDAVGKAVDTLKGAATANQKLLGGFGIEVKADGSLKLDETAFKKADMGKVKSLFNGNGSFAYQVSARASMIDYTAQREAQKANTYNKTGEYSYNYNYSYTSFI